MDQSGVIRWVIENVDDQAWETRRLAERIHRLLNPELSPDEPPVPAVSPVDSLHPLAVYPVSRRRIGTPGPPDEPYPLPPGETPRIQAPAVSPPRMRRRRALEDIRRPNPSALEPITEDTMNQSNEPGHL